MEPSKLGLKAKEMHGELANVSPGSAPLFDIVARWIIHFNDGRDSLEDEESSGPPRSSLTKDIFARAGYYG